MSKRGISVTKKQSGTERSLRDQYEIIREDILKLRDDLTKGYNMAKKAVDKKTLVAQLTGSKK
jgi:hypothetical protein